VQPWQRTTAHQQHREQASLSKTTNHRSSIRKER
jgi:hypothetical protein